MDVGSGGVAIPFIAGSGFRHKDILRVRERIRSEMSQSLL